MNIVNEPIVKGDTILFEGTLSEDITDWKIRCEIYDSCSNSIKLATENSGGADNQILITDALNGVFLITVAKNLTTCFEDKSRIEIEMETTDNPTQLFTVQQGEIDFKDQKITWTDPDA